jgi:protein ImuB
MGRLACVKLPLLALQILLKTNPEWRNFPTVLLDRDHPQGRILQANKYARRSRIEPGMRYAGGLSLCAELRASTVDAETILKVREELEDRLRLFSPNLDSPADFSRLSFFRSADSKSAHFEEPGIFWLQATGLDQLYGSFDAWAEGIYEALREFEYYAGVAVGFSRFGTYALAHSKGVGAVVLDSWEQEQRRFRAVRLARLDLDAALKESLLQLGVETVGEFLDLPTSGIARRFGQEAQRFYDFASAKTPIPIRRQAEDAPIERMIALESGRLNTERLLFQIKFELHAMMVELAARALVLGRLEMTFYMREGGEIADHVRPARPGLDEAAIIELVRLRLETLEFSEPPIRLRLFAEGEMSDAEQTRLLTAGHDRRWEDAQHALARLRAEFGPQSVLRIEQRDAHLPEGRFSLQPLETLARPFRDRPFKDSSFKDKASRSLLETDSQTPKPTLVRRILMRPEPLGLVTPAQLREEQFQQDQAQQSPYLICGGWWSERAVHREYYYVDTERGELLWVFYDRVRRGWFLHGRVE